MKTIRSAAALTGFALAIGSAPALSAQEQTQIEQAPVEQTVPVQTQVQRRPVPTSGPDTALAMATGLDALSVCGDRETTRVFVCLGWITGASAGNGWSQSLSPEVMPDWCLYGDYSLGKHRRLFVSFLEELPANQMNLPPIMLFRRAMAREYPCKEGTLEPAGRG